MIGRRDIKTDNINIGGIEYDTNQDGIDRATNTLIGIVLSLQNKRMILKTSSWNGHSF